MTGEQKTWVLALRQNLLLGVLTLSPLAISVWVLLSVVSFLDEKIYAIIPWDVRIPGIGLVAAFLLVLLTGVLARTYFGQFLHQVIDGLFARVPLVRSLYTGTKQISGAFFSENATASFKRVVWVPFPNAQSRTLGFVASRLSDTESLVFVPTAPNPTSGYVMAYPNSALVESTMDVDQAFRVIVSCGFVPGK